ncbi:hypothetical protein ACHAW6_003398, partial [Cyclotella cf. meneghiniana]
ELCCEWKDVSTSWQKLSDLKSLTLFRLLSLHLLQAFHMNQPSMVGDMGSQEERPSYLPSKFGIELALTINKAIGKSFWSDAIELEVKNVQVAFDVLSDGVTS